MRSGWSRVGLRSDDWYPYKQGGLDTGRHAQREVTQGHTGGHQVTLEAETPVEQQGVPGCRKRGGRGQRRSPASVPGALEGEGPC